MTDNQAGSADLPSEGWQVYLKPRVIAMLFLGFSAGLPLLLVGGTFSAWLRDLGIELSAIGFLSWVGMAYSIKVLWAPIIDRARVPLLSRLLGRRRAWMLLSQTIVILALAGMALSDPREHLGLIAVFAVMTAFGSATQDIAIDAYRVEAEAKHRQAAMAATYVTGYRLAILAAGAGALHIASLDSWSLAYLTMAALMGIGVTTTLLIAEPAVSISESTNRLEARVQQYLAQTRQTGWKRDLTACLPTSSSATAKPLC